MRNGTMKRLISASAIAGALLFGAAAAEAAVPQTITHQGRLYDAAGKPVNETLDVKFAIYADPASPDAIWTEIRSITFEDGYFSASLGELTPFTDMSGKNVFDGSVRYLGVTVGGDPEMSPRAAVQSVPYAMVAGDAIGDIHPTSIWVNGNIVIDGSGHWVGDPTGLIGPAGPQGPKGDGPTGRRARRARRARGAGDGPGGTERFAGPARRYRSHGPREARKARQGPQGPRDRKARRV